MDGFCAEYEGFEDRVMAATPFTLDDLVHARAVEGNRRELKATWDEQIKIHVLQTVCAFANDLLNLNGGYIILGIETDEQV